MNAVLRAFRKSIARRRLLSTSLCVVVVQIFVMSLVFVWAQKQEIVWSAQEKPIAGQIHSLRQFSDDVRAGVTKQLDIEAYPDPTPPMVDIVTQSPGLSSEEIERYITIPIETQVSGIKNLSTIRTISLYGLSDVKLQFSFDYTYDEALQQVLNRLSQMAPLPGNVQPGISPLSAIGEIYRYRLAGPPNYSVVG